MDYKDEVAAGLLRRRMNRKDLAKAINIPYNRLSQYLNEFMPMPFEIKDEIDEVLNLRQMRKGVN